MSSVFPREDRIALKRAIKLLDYDKGKFAGSVVFGSGAIGSGVALGATSAWMIARAAQLPPVLDLSVASTGVRAFGVGKAIFRYLERIASHKVALYGMANLRTTLYSTLADSPTDVVTSIKRGDLLARTGSDVDEVGDVVVKAMLPVWVAVVVSLISVGIVGYLSPLIGIVLALCLLLAGVVGPYVAMRGARIAEQNQVADRAELNTEALNLLEHAGELRVSGKLTELEESREQTEERIWKNRDRAAKPTAAAAAIDTLALALSVIAAIIIGIAQMEAGTLNGIELVVCVLTPLSAFEATQRLGAAGVQLVRSGSAAKRIMDILDSATEAEQPEPDTRPADSSGLRTQDLVIGWPGGPDVATIPDLSVNRGESLAIVGPSGIGKSTLLYTLAGMITPHSGHVSLDGREVSRLERADVSKSLTLTAEDAHIFETSILENIRVARGNVTEDEAVDLLTRAGLGDWLAQLPKGVHTIIGSDASTVSGGERRRLLLARALATDADFLLLDEPGEHLDPDTADSLIHDLLTAGGDERGVVLVTHRLSPLAVADHVIVLGPRDDGTIGVQARGTHSELLASMPQYAWSAEQEK